jgi:hypothetical protein
MVLMACAALGSAPVPPDRATPDSAVNVLVELFTSEGCESCPPADTLLIDLLRTQPVRGVHLIGLSEHVDYWDKLGWVDPFSSALFTNRQIEYSRRLGAEVYTPQVVVDGRAAVVGSSRSDVLAAIRQAAATPKPTLLLGWAPGLDRGLQITIPATAALAGSNVTLVITEDGLSNSVKRGENKGRELHHDAVTRRLTAIGSTDAAGGFSQLVALGPMIDPQWKLAALQVVVFVRNTKGLVTALATNNLQLTTNR